MYTHEYIGISIYKVRSTEQTIIVIEHRERIPFYYFMFCISHYRRFSELLSKTQGTANAFPLDTERAAVAALRIYIILWKPSLHEAIYSHANVLRIYSLYNTCILKVRKQSIQVATSESSSFCEIVEDRRESDRRWARFCEYVKRREKKYIYSARSVKFFYVTWCKDRG